MTNQQITFHSAIKNEQVTNIVPVAFINFWQGAEPVRTEDLLVMETEIEVIKCKLLNDFCALTVLGAVKKLDIICDRIRNQKRTDDNARIIYRKALNARTLAHPIDNAAFAAFRQKNIATMAIIK